MLLNPNFFSSEMKLPVVPLAGFPFHSSKLKGIQAKAAIPVNRNSNTEQFPGPVHGASNRRP